MDSIIPLIVFLVIVGSIIKGVMEKLGEVRGKGLSDEERRIQDHLRRVLGGAEPEAPPAPPPPKLRRVMHAPAREAAPAPPRPEPPPPPWAPRLSPLQQPPMPLQIEPPPPPPPPPLL